MPCRLGTGRHCLAGRLTLLLRPAARKLGAAAKAGSSERPGMKPALGS